MPKVLIVGGGFDYSSMFRKRKWQVVNAAADADLLQFTGGEDVTPELYQHTRHPTTYCNPMRDRREKIVFDWGILNKKPMAGICRGGQFLNVMCGGKMWQNVDGHAVKHGHMATDTRTGEYFWVSSTHHQMIVPHSAAELILLADEATWGEKSINGQQIHVSMKNMRDVEAILYREEKVFCFQPHPEMDGCDELADKYFGYLKEFFDLSATD